MSTRKFKIEIVVDLKDTDDPTFVFKAVEELLERGESMSVSRWKDITDEPEESAE